MTDRFKFILTLFLLISFNGFSQLSSSKKELLRTELIKNINDLRENLGLKALEEDQTLKKAAEIHSVYMAKKHVLEHREKSGTSTVKKRIRKAGSKDFLVYGENILISKVESFKPSKKEIIELAKTMFEQWKNSPPHYANMTNTEYTFGDIAFGSDMKENAIYATQVFGSKGVRIEGQLSENAFGISSNERGCEDLFQGIDNIVANIGNDIKIEDDTIRLYFHDISLFDRIVSGPKDGIAVDLISMDQFSCSSPNELDMSKIYDGIMLEPVYRKELLSRNTALSQYRLITSLGVVPESLRGKEFLVSVIMIKDGRKCRYLVPAFVPRKQYELVEVEPELINPNVKLLNEGIIQSEVLNYEFKTNVTSAIKVPRPSFARNKVHSVKIVSYSSIEGDSLKNINLHKNRGRYIESKLNSQLNLSGVKVRFDASENWAKMNFQLGYLMADSILAWPHQDIRDLVVSDDNSQNWDSLLFDQRSSRAIINYFGKIKKGASQEEIGVLNLRTAIASGDIDLANKAMYELWYNGMVNPSILFEGEVFEAFKNNPRLIQNGSALLTKYYWFDRYKATEIINIWMNRLDDLNDKSKQNLLSLYNVTGFSLLEVWDIESKKLSNVIHPRKVAGLLTDNQPISNRLNAKLTFLQYYGHVIDHVGMAESFDYIAEYAQSEEMDQDKIYDLVLFCNYWSRYDITINVLMKYFDAGTISDENAFILAHTLTQSGDENEHYFDIMKKTSEIDQIRWCEWISIEYQILRNSDIKTFFCETCN